ncbi:MAG: hypothetical protein FWB71_06725, partial [Defluviitaleaceae bacterium]|nr:hypothetical protein [Defluviitaleaceae bacterium]
VIISDEHGRVLHEYTTDATGHIPDIELAAPSIALTEDPHAQSPRYAVYTAQVLAEGWRPMTYNGIMIFDQSTSIQVIELHPEIEGEESNPEFMEIAGHALDNPTMPEPQIEPILPRILSEVIMPNFITVHLGRPENWAPNVRVPFVDYIKNVTSHEIFDTWPEEAIIANVWCITSLTLNRIFTEFYRKQGRNFDITNHTDYVRKR